MLDKNTSINDQEIILIKDKLLQEGKITPGCFEIPNNLNPNSAPTHYPVVFLVDKTQKESILYVHKIVADLMKNRKLFSEAMDVAVIEYDTDVIVHRPFAYIDTKFELRHLSEFCSVKTREDVLPNLETALFFAWYLSEVRLDQYQRIGIDYRQRYYRGIWKRSCFKNVEAVITKTVSLV